MNGKKEYFWVPPFIGGTLALIALLSPAAYVIQLHQYIYLWMWGLLVYRIYDTDTMKYYFGSDFPIEPTILITSIICSLLVLIGSFFLLYEAYINKINRKDFQQIRNNCLGISFILIINTIMWIIIYEIQIPSLWNNLNTGFGVIGVFLGASITIIGLIIANYMIKRKREIIYTGSSPYKISNVQIFSQTQTTVTPKFCPMCRIKIEQDTFRFCPGCGYEFIKTG